LSSEDEPFNVPQPLWSGQEEESEEDPDPTTCVASEDTSQRFKWIAYMESTQRGVVGNLTWDKVCVSLK